MNVLLIGSGGREHALAWALAASPLLTNLYAAPGNGGICAEAECVALDVDDHDAVIAFCKEHAIDLVVVGPEAPLVAGIADALDAAGIKVFGPSAAAAQLEGSKGFTKALCREANIPTADPPATVGDIASLVALDGRHRDVGGLRNDQVWTAAPPSVAAAAGDGDRDEGDRVTQLHRRRGVLFPADLLADVVSILHPDLLGSHERVYYRHLR